MIGNDEWFTTLYISCNRIISAAERSRPKWPKGPCESYSYGRGHSRNNNMQCACVSSINHENVDFDLLIQYRRRLPRSRCPRETLLSWEKGSSLRSPAAPPTSTRTSVLSGISLRQRWDWCRESPAGRAASPLSLCEGDWLSGCETVCVSNWLFFSKETTHAKRLELLKSYFWELNGFNAMARHLQLHTYYAVSVL